MPELANMQKKIAANLPQAIANAMSIVSKSYLQELDEYAIKELTAEEKDIDIADCGKFFRLSKLVMNKEENFLNKLITIVNVAFSVEGTLAAILRSDGSQTEVWLGIVSKKFRLATEKDQKRREADALAFRGALEGNLPGSDLTELAPAEVSQFKKAVLEAPNAYYASISGIAGLRSHAQQDIAQYVQGMENLIDALSGQKYTIVTIADPINTGEIQQIKQGYEMMHTELSTFLKSIVTLNESDSISLSEAQTSGISEGISQGITYTQSRTKSRGQYFGGNIGVGFSLAIPGANIGNIGVSAGVHKGTNSSVADTSGTSSSTVRSSQSSRSATSTIGNTKSTGKSLQLSFENKSIKVLLDKIDKQLARIEHCENYGAFDCASYVIADSQELAFSVAGNYNALLRGDSSGLQVSQINSWYKAEKNQQIGQYLKSLVHPKFYAGEDKSIVVTPASITSGREMALQMGLPTKSVQGLTVVSAAAFGRNPKPILAEERVELGELYYMGKTSRTSSSQKVSIDAESLRGHCFVTGSTGAGKSTLIYRLLDQLIQRPVKGRAAQQVKFMVIEPAKGEYKNRFGAYENVRVYGSNFRQTPLLRLNPFAFPREIHVLEHIERLIEIFNVCWPMYAAMPAVLKDALERAYQFAGWDLNTSECKYEKEQGAALYPGFQEVLAQIDEVMNTSQYSADSKSDYKGALSTRIRSLTTGLYRQIFSANALSDEELFEQNVIIDLSRISSAETKALLMGFLVLKLQEYRMAKTALPNQPLQHITVLEEAHHLLRRTGGINPDGSNLTAKSVEMLSNAVAEMRTYGEGFLIVDQSPAMMDLSAIRNTNTKIILRLPDFADRQLVGQAAGLNPAQIDELAKLNTFVAAAYQNEWLEPILCQFDYEARPEKPYHYQPPVKAETDEKQLLVKFLLIPFRERAEVAAESLSKIKRIVLTGEFSAAVKVWFLEYLQAARKEEGQVLREKMIGEIFNAEELLRRHQDKQGEMPTWLAAVRVDIDPTGERFSAREGQKLAAILLKNEHNRLPQEQTKHLFEELLRHIGEGKNEIV